ncbi:hypothetical protein COUCH_19290 [Couchioplanes caeruleus]|uniref:hypothetical protein n=1 Tax=Couchioplanes caeruleus TaxID=56438 RepID=UPI0020BD5CB0|nr:hypothetical protein [Couchioplanes caeruleus]UQU68298.1 hypothetical protein COUCH_19290 [Couchioplanes caeruleus]
MARYDLAPGAAARAVAGFLGGLPADRLPADGRFLAVFVADGDPLADVARHVERTVFEAAFGNDEAVMTAEYGPYESDSLFVLVMDRERAVPAGAARIIDGRGKTIDDAPRHIGVDTAAIVAAHGLGSGRIWDCAVAAVLPGYRGRGSALEVSSLLYRTYLLAGVQAGVEHSTSMLDCSAYRNFQLLGVPMRALAGSGPFPYLGSPENYAVYMHFPDIVASVAAQARALAGTDTPQARAGALASHMVATGEGIDDRILLAVRR